MYVRELADGTVVAEVFMGRDKAGKKKRKSYTFHPPQNVSKRDRQAAIDAWKVDLARQIKESAGTDLADITVEEMARSYLAHIRLTITPREHREYERMINLHIVPAVGPLKVADINTYAINSFLAALAAPGARKDGKPGSYANATIIKIRNLLNGILEEAVDCEIIKKNPCRKAITPKNVTGENGVMCWSAEQVASFLDFIEKPYQIVVQGHHRCISGKSYEVGSYTETRKLDEQKIILFWLAIFTGARKQELLALNFSDVDYDNAKINIAIGTTTDSDGKQILGPTKSPRGVRTVSIPRVLTDRLAALRDERRRHREFMGGEWPKEDFIFIQSNGRQMCLSTPYQRLQDMIQRYNDAHSAGDQLPVITFHQLRHTCCSLMLADGGASLPEISARMGHAKISTTVNVYAHMIRNDDANSLAALERQIPQHKE